MCIYLPRKCFSLQFDDVKKLKKTLAVIHQIFCLLIKYGDLKEPSPKEKGIYIYFFNLRF